jgi:hypothetical protein
VPQVCRQSHDIFFVAPISSISRSGSPPLAPPAVPCTAYLPRCHGGGSTRERSRTRTRMHREFCADPTMRSAKGGRRRSEGVVPSFRSALSLRFLVARIERSEIREFFGFALGAHPGFHFVQPGLRRKEETKGNGTPTDAVSQPAVPSGTAALPLTEAHAYRRPTAMFSWERRNAPVQLQAMLPGTRPLRLVR